MMQLSMRSLHAMHPKDLSLLAALDLLLTEGSVARAAARMNLSTPAMSRILGHIRDLTGDPIFVRAGRSLVPTPRAEAMRLPVRELVARARSILGNAGDLDLDRLDRTFTLRATDSFIGSFGPRLAGHLTTLAPKVRLRFVPQRDESVDDLREGQVDLDIGAISHTGPEIMTQTILSDRFVGVVRPGHPLSSGRITSARFSRQRHISASRRGRMHGPVDQALGSLNLSRNVVTIVPTFSDALLFARQSELVAVVPDRLTEVARQDMVSFPLPVETGLLIISQAWHPRFQADATHQWLRACVREICAEDTSSKQAYCKIQNNKIR
ncbi:transcriptional regulator, LysR family [Gluconacetobacter diazotrophicus PA1 5]|nr:MULTISPECIES: LysR family transcriptional regulator [Acetobacteraceae]ACI51486.1 transcriptional regulator, LysR family [Gluconacetobacter diazotrophicus PA1 5]TWA97728.1 DNA-binding transcriptional LysR family regulator [Gluconacetobacter diazotrophicus]